MSVPICDNTQALPVYIVDATGTLVPSFGGSGTTQVQGVDAVGAATTAKPVGVGGVVRTNFQSSKTVGTKQDVSLSQTGLLGVTSLTTGPITDGLSASYGGYSLNDVGSYSLPYGINLIYNGTSLDRQRDATSTNATTGTGIQASGSMAKYNATSPTYTDGQFGNVQMDSRGSTYVAIKSANGSVGVSATTGSTDANAAGTGGLVTQSNGYVFNGTTFDRQRDITSSNNTSSAIGVQATGPLYKAATSAPTYTSGNYGSPWMYTTGATMVSLVNLAGVALSVGLPIGDAVNPASQQGYSTNSFNYIFNGTTYDRQRDATSANNTTGTGVIATSSLGKASTTALSYTGGNYGSPWLYTTGAAMSTLAGANGNVVGVNQYGDGIGNIEWRLATQSFPVVYNPSGYDRVRDYATAHNTTGTGVQANGNMGYASNSAPTAVTSGNVAKAWYSQNGAQFTVLTDTNGFTPGFINPSADAGGSQVGAPVWTQGRVYNGSTWDRQRGDTNGTWVTARGGSNMATSQVSVTTTATLVAAARATRQKVTITSTTAVAFYIGNSGVTTTTGAFIASAAGASITLDTNAAVYAVVATGTLTVSVLELY